MDKCDEPNDNKRKLDFESDQIKKKIKLECDLMENLNKMQICINSDDLFCPITKEIFCVPVIADDGFTYEKKSLIKYLESNTTSPITRERMYHVYYENKMLKDTIHNFLIQNPEFAHLQFSKENYTEYASNIKECHKFLEKQNWNKALEFNNIHFNNELSNNSTIGSYLCIKLNDEIIFNKLIDNMIDLQIPSETSVLPIHVIAANCKLKGTIVHAISKNLDLYNYETNESIVKHFCYNKNLNNNDRIFIIKYLIEQNKINFDFIDKDKVSDMYYIMANTYHYKDLYILDDKTYAHSLFVCKILGKICSGITKNTLYLYIDILEKISESVNIDKLICMHYTFYKNYPAEFTSSGIEETLFLIFESLNNNPTLDNNDKYKIFGKIKILLVDKLNMPDILSKINIKVTENINDMYKNKNMKLEAFFKNKISKQ